MKSSCRVGFTLIETIIYVALLGALLSGAIVAAFSLSDGAEKNITALETKEEAAFIEDKMGWALRNATSVSVSGNRLTIYRMTDDTFAATGNPIVFYRANSKFLIQRGTASPVPLTDDTSPVSAFGVSLKSSGHYRQVSVTFDISGETFATTYSVYIP